MTTDNPASRNQTASLGTLADVPAADRRPMSRAESGAFIQCSMMDTAKGRDQEAAAIANEFSEAPSALRVLLQRVVSARPQAPLRVATVLFLATISDNPGDCVLWAFYLVKRSDELGRAVTIEDLALLDFPNGFPTNDGRTAVWDQQKGHLHGRKCDNLLDTREPWAPIRQEACP